MNKIKVINTEVLKQLKNSKKQLRVKLIPSTKRKQTLQTYFDEFQNFQESLSFKRRPLTPSDVIRNLYQRNSSKLLTTPNFWVENGRQKRKQRIKTVNPDISISYEQLERMKNKKSQGTNNNRPQSWNRQQRYSANKKSQSQQKQRKKEADHVNELKYQIQQVFSSISQSNRLTKNRMDKKIGQYKENKFGKFWKIHNLKRISAKRIKATLIHNFPNQ